MKTLKTSSYCAPSPDSECACSGNAIALYGAFCNPVATVGPGGAWQRIEVVKASGPCPPGGTCVESWTLTPDGHLAMTKEGKPSTAELMQLELDDLAMI